MSRNETFTLTIECALEDEYFDEWNDLSPELQNFWSKEENFTNCEGSGEMGTYCTGCPFCNLFELDY
jgi:hypothetical protein